MKKHLLIRRIAIISILAAISTVFYLPFTRVSLPFIFPGFLELQLSNLPALIGGLALGPLSGCIIVLLKTILKICISASQTAYVGDIADVFIGLACVFTASMIYKKIHTRKGADLALFFGACAWIVMALIANYLFLVDFYISFYMHGVIESFVGACKVIPGITIDNYKIMYLFYGCLPFNLILSTIVCLLTSLLYKRISKLVKHFIDS